jgi:uncharacterized membrane protein
MEGVMCYVLIGMIGLLAFILHEHSNDGVLASIINSIRITAVLSILAGAGMYLIDGDMRRAIVLSFDGTLVLTLTSLAFWRVLHPLPILLVPPSTKEEDEGDRRTETKA